MRRQHAREPIEAALRRQIRGFERAARAKSLDPATVQIVIKLKAAVATLTRAAR